MDKLTPNDKSKLQNILQYYIEYCKTHYDDIIGIEIDNKKRQQKQKEIDKQLQKIKNIKKTEQYVLLKDEKCDINKQIMICKDNIDEFSNKEYEVYNKDIYDIEEVKIIWDKMEKLYYIIETIEHKQLDIITENGIDTEFLENSNIKIQL